MAKKKKHPKQSRSDGIVEVAAYLCGFCTEMHRIPDDAEQCCMCEKCDAQADDSKGWDKLCRRHRLKGHIREKQGGIRRQRRQLQALEESLIECKGELADLDEAAK